MEAFYRLQINFDDNVETLNAISNLLEVTPNNNLPNWVYEIAEKSEDPFFDFVNNFLAILENKYDALATLGIKRSDISFWYLYEYDQQCNMEFDPNRLKRLGDNGITLCISCWAGE